MPLYTRDDKAREIALPPGPDYRAEFRRDYARLIHCPAFRRLQGKTQLFPGVESDFFRNRLTHSIEVAQVAKSIALKLNATEEALRDDQAKIDTDLVEFAALAHDLGHPPFGHDGEAILDQRMLKYGGFEGNAQTLRILTKIEKKQLDETAEHPISSQGLDRRVGLNLTFRSLASVIKYDAKIPSSGKSRSAVKKGYYASEEPVVDRIKGAVCGADAALAPGRFKTVECHIMDIADDIAYSTYDLEDALKAGFVDPIGVVAASDETLSMVADKVSVKINKRVASDDVANILTESLIDEGSLKILSADDGEFDTRNPSHVARFIADIKNSSDKFSASGFYRSKLTSDLVGEAIESIELEYNEQFPALSKVSLGSAHATKIEVLKNFVYCSLIESPRLKIVEYRGKEIVATIFEALTGDGGAKLLPDDYKKLHDACGSKKHRNRTVCDFIAGMTDRYALEFYGRLKSENPQTIFKPF